MARSAWHLKLLATSCRRAPGAGFKHTDRNRIMEIAYRFAGFGTAVCTCTAGIPSGGELERLHLVPARQEVPDVLRVMASDLSSDRTDLTEWV
jgi:methoxymalonate biosynthesis protein